MSEHTTEAAPAAHAGLRLEPGVLDWLSRIDELIAADARFRSPDLAEQRAAALDLSDALARDFTAPAPTGVSIDELELDSGERMLRLRRYRPAALPSGPAPTQVFLHGGGFVKGSPRELQNDRILAARASEAGVQILSLTYRLAPEHPYPAARDDLTLALEAILADPAALGVDARRLGVGGNSAGASIAASAALKWCAEGRAPLAHLCLEVPAVAIRDFGESYRLYGSGFGLDDIDQLTALILPPGAADEYASPLAYLRGRRQPVPGFPPALVMTAEYDPLRDTGEAFAHELERLGHAVTLYRGEGQLHGSSSLSARTDGARLWQRHCADALRVAYATDEEGEHAA
ncbi:alpha/beta hydrolase fold domain-containing protein [Gryllotalpicola ginsengisoli]|uniref:alpha/beta hydrolase fold domain-containing protein n=1 Tax=Gryllotalpicola ginsengisoli TaxID=444608 RepID=UPI0003B4B854|nr:alpha/beta hydrolase fold domain-containing protein [Gryllotalpicola ginsengisoli]